MGAVMGKTDIGRRRMGVVVKMTNHHRRDHVDGNDDAELRLRRRRES
jgi:hypothetical protein